jgi:hypothetical protein
MKNRRRGENKKARKWRRIRKRMRKGRTEEEGEKE